MNLLDSVIPLISPLLFHEERELDSYGNTINLRRGVELGKLCKIFKRIDDMIQFYILLQNRLKNLGLSLKIYSYSNSNYLTAIANAQMPSNITDPQALILATVLSLSQNSNEIHWRVVEKEVVAMNVETINVRKELEALVNQGLLLKSSLNPLKVSISPIFYLEFSDSAKKELLNLMHFHFLIADGGSED